MTDPAEKVVGARATGIEVDGDELSDDDLEHVVGGLARAWPVRDEPRSSDGAPGAEVVAGTSV
jgi:hypothetical protein